METDAQALKGDVVLGKGFCRARRLGTIMTDTERSGTGQAEVAWAQRWAEMLEHARKRPQMYIGGLETAHRNIVEFPLRVVWQARLFRRPQQVRIDLSLRQCVVRCDTGPLIRPIQQALSFPGGKIMGDTWPEESRLAIARFHDEQTAIGIPFDDKKYKRSWRYAFSGPTGPRLNWVAGGALLARRLTWGLRTDQGLWCQAYEGGWPVGTPFLVEDTSPVGLIVLADLDPQWWTGLPYAAEDVEHFRASSHRPQGLDERWKPEPPWSTGEITVDWHEQDDLVTEPSLTAEGVREWLK